MTVIISSEANAPLPAAGEVTLFINTDKNNILYAKYPDGSVIPYNGASDANSAEIAKAWMDALNCGLKSGMISADDYHDLMDQGITVQTNSSMDEDGNYSSTLSVGSRSVTLTSITLDDDAVELDLSALGTHQIETEFSPSNVSNLGLIYVSSDPTKATVSETGLIEAVGVGSSLISVIPQADPSKVKIVTVTVVA